MKTILSKPLLIPLLLILTSQALYAFYDPQTQRWINRDPLREQGFEASRDVPPPEREMFLRPGGFTKAANLYALPGNSPLNHIDPYGLELFPPIGPSSPLGTPGVPYSHIDSECFNNCMKKWLGGNCWNYALGTAVSAGIYAAGNMTWWYAGFPFDAGWVLGYTVGGTLAGSGGATIGTAVTTGTVAAGGMVAAAATGWALGTVIQCGIECSR